MAWLNAVPKPPEGSQREKQGNQAAKLSRLDRLKKLKAAVPMPPNPMPHIIKRLTEIGLCEVAGMGTGPLTWLTLDAWQRSTGVELLPWEARLLRQLSIVYVAEGRRAEAETCPAPWHPQATEEERRASEDQLRMVLG